MDYRKEHYFLPLSILYTIIEQKIVYVVGNRK